MHRIVLNMARCMVFARGLPLHFLGRCNAVCRVYFRFQPKQLEFKRGFSTQDTDGKKRSISAKVVFGSPCTVYHDPGRKAWKPRAEIGMIVGKNDKQNWFEVYHPHKKLVVTTQHVQ